MSAVVSAATDLTSDTLQEGDQLEELRVCLIHEPTLYGDTIVQLGEKTATF